MSREQYSLDFSRQPRHAPSLAENAAWGLFLLAALGGFNFALSDEVEKAWWLAADVAAFAAVLGASGLYVAKARQLWPLFSWPLLAFVSAIWSLTPGLTAYHAAQLLMTMVVGLVMQERLGLYRIVILLFIALAVGIMASFVVVALGRPYAVSPRGDWNGIYEHKNVLGVAAAMLIYSGFVLAKKYWPVLLPILALAITALVHARSATSFVVLGAVTVIIPVTFALRLRPYSLAAAGSFLAAAGALAAGFLLTEDTTILQDALAALGRDSTLTGRSDLWNFGWQAFLDHPLIGLGYKAYWASDTTSVAYLRYFVGQDLWYFHDNWLEVAVGMGLIGFVVFNIALVHVLVLVIRANRRIQDVPAVWSLLFLVHVLILCAVENPLFFNHSFMQILFVAVAASAAAVLDRTQSWRAAQLPILGAYRPA